jgi:hypothetical protein
MSRRRASWRDRLSWAAAIGTVVAVVLLVPGIAPASLRNLVGAGPTPLGTPPVVPAGGTYAFLHHQKSNSQAPVAWDPCKEIEYVVNPDGAGQGEVDMMHAAIAETSRATGLRFRDKGHTDRRPGWDARTPRSAWDDPVLIAWAHESEVPDLAGDTAGIGGAVPMPARNGTLRYTTGMVTFDLDAFASISARPDSALQKRAIMLHELGHLVGLDHVDSPAELMHSDNVGRRDFGLGDANGLARLGSGTCL